MFVYIFSMLISTMKVSKNKVLAHIAQVVEHVLGKDEVSGSIPLVGSSRCCALKA